MTSRVKVIAVKNHFRKQQVIEMHSDLCLLIDQLELTSKPVADLHSKVLDVAPLGPTSLNNSVKIALVCPKKLGHHFRFSSKIFPSCTECQNRHLSSLYYGMVKDIKLCQI